jgi:hypothetical protein
LPPCPPSPLEHIHVLRNSGSRIHTRQGVKINMFFTGANTPATAGEHALRQGAGEEDGPSRTDHQEARTAEVANQQDMDQYVAPPLAMYDVEEDENRRQDAEWKNRRSAGATATGQVAQTFTKLTFSQSFLASFYAAVSSSNFSRCSSKRLFQRPPTPFTSYRSDLTAATRLGGERQGLWRDLT